MDTIRSRRRVVTGRRASTSGFTAIELLITVAIVGVVAALAVPALRDLVLNNRAVSRINEFVAAVNLARNEAVKRGTPVTLCAPVPPHRPPSPRATVENSGKRAGSCSRTMTGTPNRTGHRRLSDRGRLPIAGMGGNRRHDAARRADPDNLRQHGGVPGFQCDLAIV